MWDELQLLHWSERIQRSDEPVSSTAVRFLSKRECGARTQHKGSLDLANLHKHIIGSIECQLLHPIHALDVTHTSWISPKPIEDESPRLRKRRGTSLRCTGMCIPPSVLLLFLKNSGGLYIPSWSFDAKTAALSNNVEVARKMCMRTS
jgi:hypothetical protein